MKKLISIFLGLFLLLGFTSVVQAYTPPSTNDINRTNGWAHVNETSVDVGEVTLDFVQPRNFYACFEYRTDGDTSQVINEEHWLESYGVVDESEGLQQYPYNCLSTAGTLTKTITANEYVEVRMIFGAEGDERFDWTRFDVLLFDRIAEITSPSDGEVVSGPVSFDATLNDKDSNDDVQWAVRKGICAAGVGTVFGNVDGYNDSFDWDGTNFHASTDVSTWEDGDYCFIFNPKESAGDAPIRETREFVVSNPPSDKDECKKGGWMTFNNPTFKNQGDCVSYLQSNEKAGKR